ncbi:MAG: PIN domain-containing protein [Nitrospirae bacterium]|nr:PIN domain-containing protein [Nitrospirota bacterium]
MKHRDCLLDTNIIGNIIELISGCNTDESDPLQMHWDIKKQHAFLCPITVGEIEYGLRVAPDENLERHRLVREFLSQCVILNIDDNIARDYYADLRARLFDYCAPRNKRERKNYNKRVEEWKDPATSKEIKIQENDLWIAAVAMAHNLILVTRDKMDAIKKVAGSDIVFENWLE